MKKKIILLTILITSFSIFSQQKTFNLNWDGVKDVSTNFVKREIPSFSGGILNYNPTDGMTFVSRWSVSNPINEQSVIIQNQVFEPISISDLKDLDTQLIPNQLKVSLKNSRARNEQFALLEVTPIIKEKNGYKKLVSFTLIYNSNPGARTSNSFQMQQITNSALSSGSWYKFYVERSGVHRISKSFLADLGVNVNQVDPRTIKLYGNGGKMIPFENDQDYPFDVVENAIRVVGESDAQFNDSDYILFYAQGPRGWDSEKRTHINCYTDKTYYYINISPGNGKRVQPFIQPSGSVDMEISTFDDYKFHELDEYNLVNVGRRWFGDRFDIEDTKSFEFSFPDRIESEPIYLNVIVASTSPATSTMGLTVNGTNVTTLNLPATSNYNLAVGATFANYVPISSSNINVTLQYNNNGSPSALAYVDYVAVRAKRNLNFSGNQYTFRNLETTNETGIAQYTVTNTSQVSEIWDVSDLYNVTTLVNGDGNSTLSFKSQMGSEKSYTLVTSSDFYTPLRESNSQVFNQNLKGTIFNDDLGNFQDIDYLILTPQVFLGQANRLAQINRDQYGLNVKVVPLGLIYNEFSTGNPDIGAIRNFVKYIYDNASSPSQRLKYLCLFGDASFDYKNRLPNNTNFVPSWHAYESFNLTSSYVSDDFFGMMDENEGDMSISNLLDIAVGRVLADSPQQAKEMVDKIQNYHSEASFGNWRNTAVFISDDVDEAWEAQLQQTTDNISDEISEEKPFINVVKIHSDAFEQESSSGGDRYPTVNTAIVNALEKGALVVNYFGHGGEDGLARERIFERSDAQSLNNICQLNCFVTVTCEFTRFDNPLRPTAGEYTFWNTQGGAIGLITTTRQVIVNVGIDFNVHLEKFLFGYDDSFAEGEYPSMAEALRLTKIDPEISGYDQRRLVFFIGDPAMKLTFGKPNIHLTTINDEPISGNTDVLQALSKVKLAGEVTDGSGNLLTNFNGVLSTTVFDKNIERQTLGNNGVTGSNGLIIMDFETLGPTIFKGQSTITGGQFEMEFVVPRDIAIPEGYGKVSFYAKQDGVLFDRSGASVETVKIGGLNPNAETDEQGPLIKVFMNDESFVSGGLTNNSPALLLKLQDDNGINTASGIGHDIVAILDGDETSPYVLNDYYETELDDYQRGTVNYPFRDLENGLHTLTVKAWDVYNNSATAEIQFMVQNENQELVIDKVLNYPNPFVNYTEFWFNHNSSQPLDVSVQIFTVSGKLVKTINGQTNTSNCCNNGNSSLSRDMIWDGRDDFGDRIGKGVYIYKLKVHSPSLNKTVEKIEKLVIL